VEAFLKEYCLSFVEDSSNGCDDFLRNRIRHHVMPLLTEENPRFAENTSAMAQRLRQDEAALAQKADFDELPDVQTLKAMSPAVRSRVLERFLKSSGVKEPEKEHILLAESLVFSEKPSAQAQFPDGVTVTRVYGRLQSAEKARMPRCRITCGPAEEIVNTGDTFTVRPVGTILVRSRRSGDEMRLPGGTKSLKKLFIDRKIPAALRDFVPVVADDAGVLGVYGIGVNLDRVPAQLPAVRIRLEDLDTGESYKDK
jgi:tRNA(Ile)-lysidine synthase